MTNKCFIKITSSAPTSLGNPEGHIRRYIYYHLEDDNGRVLNGDFEQLIYKKGQNGKRVFQKIIDEIIKEYGDFDYDIETGRLTDDSHYMLQELHKKVVRHNNIEHDDYEDL